MTDTDSGKGIRRLAGLLVSDRYGRRLRWLAPWLQALACRAHVFADRAQRPYGLVATGAVLVFVLALTLPLAVFAVGVVVLIAVAMRPAGRVM